MPDDCVLPKESGGEGMMMMHELGIVLDAKDSSGLGIMLMWGNR